MSYSKDEITAQSEDIEYAARTRRRAVDNASEAAPFEADENVAPDKRQRGNLTTATVRAAAGAKRARGDAAVDPDMGADSDNMRGAQRRSARRGDFVDDFDEPDSAAEARARYRKASVDDDQSDDEYADDEPVRRKGGLFGNIGAKLHGGARNSDSDADDFDDEPSYDEADESEQPRKNWFMNWLESLRIVEEVPEDQVNDAESPDGEVENEPEATAKGGAHAQVSQGGARRPAIKRQSLDPDADTRKNPASVPLPTGRQRRGEIAEYSEDDVDAQADANPVPPIKQASESRRSYRTSAAVDEAADLNAAADIAPSDAPSNVDSASVVKAVAIDEPVNAQTASAYKQESVSVDTQADGAASADAQADADTDEDVKVSRRARRAGFTQSAITDRPRAEEAQFSSDNNDGETDAAADKTLETEYINADLSGKRKILLEQWRAQFVDKLVIPAKPDKLKSISGMVSAILNACPDENVLNARWEKLEAMIDRYASAVVAEYGYRSLLSDVEAEEKQRVYGRPTNEPTTPAPQIPTQAQTQPANEADPVDRPPEFAASAAVVEAKSAMPQRANPAPAKPAPEISEPDAKAAIDKASDGNTDEYDAVADDFADDERDSAPRTRAGSKRDYSYESAPRRESGIAKLMARVKDFGNRDRGEKNSDEYSAPVEGGFGKLKQLFSFKKGDVLDYSSEDESPEAEQTFDDYDEKAPRAKSAKREYDYSADGETEYRYAKTANSVKTEKDDYDDARQGDSYSHSDDYMADDGRDALSERQPYASDNPADGDADAQYAQADAQQGDYSADIQDDAYSRSDDYIANDKRYAANDYQDERDDYQGYSRGSAEQNKQYRSDNAAQYDDDARRDDYGAYDADDSYAPQGRGYTPVARSSVYDESDADYSADRPDYSRDYADDDEIRGQDYSADYQDYPRDPDERRDGYQRPASDGYTRPNPVSRG